MMFGLKHSYTCWPLQVVAAENKKGPCILFVKDVEKAVIGNFEYHAAFKSKLEKLDGGIVVIGSHTLSDNRKEKVHHTSDWTLVS